MSAHFIFWTSLMAIAYSYLIYPALLRIRAGKKTLTPPEDPTEWPTVEVVFAAYNEEGVLEEKLQSVLNSDYPKDKLSVRVGSDASTDKTDAILENIAASDDRLTWRRFGGRSGKANIINALTDESSADILIPTDANIMFTKNTVKQLVRWFGNDRTSIVGANIIYEDANKKGIAPQEDFYLRRENNIKEREGLLYGTAMGIEGGCYAIRKDAFRPIPKNYFMEDFFQSMQVMQRGEDVLVDTKAIVYEDVSTEIREEYQRKVRISIGNFQNLKHFYPVLYKQTFPLGFVFFSHKVLRWVTPFLLLIMLFSSLQMAFSGATLHQWLIVIAILWIGITVAQVKRIASFGGIPSFAAHFLYMNLALFHGFIKFSKGVKSNVWKPTKRKQA